MSEDAPRRCYFDVEQFAQYPRCLTRSRASRGECDYPTGSPLKAYNIKPDMIVVFDYGAQSSNDKRRPVVVGEICDLCSQRARRSTEDFSALIQESTVAALYDDTTAQKHPLRGESFSPHAFKLRESTCESCGCHRVHEPYYLGPMCSWCNKRSLDEKTQRIMTDEFAAGFARGQAMMDRFNAAMTRLEEVDRSRFDTVMRRLDELEAAAKPATATPRKEKGPTIMTSLATDATDAAWRTAGSQLVKLTRDPLAALLCRHLGPDDPALRARIAAFLQTELGAAIVAALVSGGLSALPFNAGMDTDRMARELRVRAMAGAGDVLADVLMGPLREVAVTYLRGDATAPIAPPPALLDAPSIAPPTFDETLANERAPKAKVKR